jgi:hypothetical protein
MGGWRAGVAYLVTIAAVALVAYVVGFWVIYGSLPNWR